VAVTISIRPAVQKDLGELERLVARSVRGLGAGFYTDEQIEASLVHVFGVDTQLIADGTYFVAGDGGLVAGCGGWSRRRTLFGSDRWKADLVDDLLDPRVDAARVRAFFVAPEHARRGIGRLLLLHCERLAAAEGYRRLQLVATLPGVPLYSAMGYVAVEPVDIPMPGGISLPAVRMEKAVTPGSPD
jgi:GNAT superfamily N-acetyltransferase